MFYNLRLIHIQQNANGVHKLLQSNMMEKKE